MVRTSNVCADIIDLFRSKIHTASFPSRVSAKASVTIWLRPSTMSWVHGIQRPPPWQLCDPPTVAGLRRCYESSWPPVHIAADIEGPACAVVEVWHCDIAGVSRTNECWNDRYEEKRTQSGGSVRTTTTAAVTSTTSFSGHQRPTK